jgi:uncharacterized protein
MVIDRHFVKKNFLGNRRKIILGLAIALYMVLIASVGFAAEKYPSPRGTAVNDFANVIDQENAAKMEALAREVLQKTGCCRGDC